MIQREDKSNSKTLTNTNIESITIDEKIVISEYSPLESIHWLTTLIQQREEELDRDLSASQLEIECVTKDASSPISQILEDAGNAYINLPLLALALASKAYENKLTPLTHLMNDYPEVGGVYDSKFKEFLPTIKTVAFLIAGNSDTNIGLVYEQLKASRLIQEQIINLHYSADNNNFKNAIISLNDNYFSYITTGKQPRLGITPDFPAQQLITSRTFDEIILRDSTKEQLEDLMLYAQYVKALQKDRDAQRLIKPGFIGLFYGPPGTGKSLTASVIGNELNIDVYRIDLSRLVSKYIGETEKNLEKVFQRFDGKNCILFFDEADSLFGKRSEVKDAKDRYANQEISYLLQRVEVFSGIVILATNLKDNMDDAFKRRVLSWTHFPRPDAEERLKLWKAHLPNGFNFESDETINMLAEKYELTGAYIANVMKLSCVRALGNQSKVLTKNIIEPYILDIYKREGINKNMARTSMQRNPYLKK